MYVATNSLPLQLNGVLLGPLSCSYNVSCSALRLEGQVPRVGVGGGERMVGGVPGFTTPQLPRPGQKVTRKNALKIEKYVCVCVCVHVRVCCALFSE